MMNCFEGKITKIKTNTHFSLIKVSTNNCVVSAIVLNSPIKTYTLGAKIKVIFKETEVIIGKGHKHSISIQNKFKGIIKKIETNTLLSKISINSEIGFITAIITTSAVNKLALEINSPITAMVKTNEVLLAI